MPAALLALAIGAFGIGTTEFVIAGLLPQVASSLSVPIPTAGLLISGYALSVAVGAPLLTMAGSRLSRKTMLLVLLGFFITGNLICASAASFWILMTGRIVTALCHGAFFGIGSVVAADLVPTARRASAIALMFTGLTVANVLGVPLGTALGQEFGWRSTFMAVTMLGIIALCSIVILVPPQAQPSTSQLRGELTAFRNPQVWLALLMTTLGFGGVFASFTYIAPMMTNVAGFRPGAVTWLLILFGIGLCIGNTAGGRIADRHPVHALYFSLSALTATLVLFVFTAQSQIPAAITVLLFGVSGFATVPALQTRMLTKAKRAPALASTANIAGFNLGNAIGAWLGGMAISSGLGYTAPNWIGALLTAAGLVTASVAVALDHPRRRRDFSSRPPSSIPSSPKHG